MVASSIGNCYLSHLSADCRIPHPLLLEIIDRILTRVFVLTCKKKIDALLHIELLDCVVVLWYHKDYVTNFADKDEHGKDI